MNAVRTHWRRVSKAYLCPICSKPDWCIFTGDPADPQAVICARIESPKRCGQAGWLHRLRNDSAWHAPRTRTLHITALTPASRDWQMLVERYATAVNPTALQCLADDLNLTVESLHRLNIGRAPGAWAFPMTDAVGTVRGIRLRLNSGRKLSVKGGREGLFIPNNPGIAGEMLLICEGPTDCAALLDLGFVAIGRPSCNSGVRMIVELVKVQRIRKVVIVADDDEPGQRGAENLASVLVVYVPIVRIITPPDGIKDARQWKSAGATHTNIQEAIDAAPARRLEVRSQYHDHGGWTA